MVNSLLHSEFAMILCMIFIGSFMSSTLHYPKLAVTEAGYDYDLGKGTTGA